MKNWTWKQWAALGIVVAVIVAAVVCHLVQPVVSYAYLELIAGGTFVLGGIAGYWFGSKYNNKESLLLD